jgi:hypothetical protein
MRVVSCLKVSEIQGGWIFANLVIGRIIAGFCVDTEWRKTLGSSQFDFDLAPTGAAGAIIWVIAQIYWLRNSALIFVAMSGSSCSRHAVGATP